MTGPDAQKTILVVDDEPDIVSFLTTLLEDNGYKAVIAENGEEASKAVQAAKPDLVSLDITMPEKSGVKFYRELKENPDTSNIPVIMVTGMPEVFENFISTRKQVPPPEGYINKPLKETKYLEMIKELIG